MRRALIVAHRWSSLILGLVLVVECTTGVVLLYHAEIFRAQHSAFYQHTDTAPVISTEQAVELVRASDPAFDIGWVGTDGGIIAVGDKAYASAYSIDPGTGRINERVDLVEGPLGWLVNLHDCAFGCLSSPGAVPALHETVPLLDLTWSALILGVLGLLLVVLAVTGAIIWWPSLKRWKHGFRVRRRKGRFARDFDLHNVIGIISVPFLLMWGVTGAAIEMPFVEKAWLATTGGDTELAPAQDIYTPRPSAEGSRQISVTEATDSALRAKPGRLAYLMLPTPATPYYVASVAGDYAPYGERAFYSGDVSVYVNAADATDTKVVDKSHDRPLANTFYDKVFEPAHFGWLVNDWWRIVWAILGLSPLALMVTGLSTWFFKRRTRRNANAAKAKQRQPAIDRDA
ncbi:PepSY-associated TM helix domain-containing protein [Nocardia callitridis]|uniref:PepSY-associated TM helix domain-containing protein n=1 Tax=Nocardia callitridis TaxID=648753 RepID=A0ABP9K3I6_9NOCA